MSETTKNRTGQSRGSSSRSANAARTGNSTRSGAVSRSAGTGRTTGQRAGGATSRSAQGASRQRNAERVAAVQSARSMNSGAGSARRSTATNRRRRRRRQGPDFAKILLILIGIVILILCVAVGLKGCSKDGDESIAAETTLEPETELDAEITVNGISVNGMTKSEAKEKLLKEIDWGMRVSFNGETKEIANLMETKLDEVLDEAFDKAEAGEYTVKTDGLEELAKQQADIVADGWDIQPKNGSIDSYDKNSGEFVFAGAENGKLIEREKLTADILAAVNKGDYKANITATATEVEPEITEAEARASFKRLGTYTTTTTSNKDRNENVRIAAAAINGMIIQPGHEFSFNLTTGNRTAEKGYRPAGAYVNGVLVEEPGGGVCQVSSTLYNAVVFSGLKTTERHAHSYEPSYVTPGEDAMVSYDGHSGPDMKFVNNSKTAVGIKTSFSNQKLTVSIYGNPILEEGVTLSMSSSKVKELDPPAPVYEEDPTLEPGVEVQSKAPTMGSRWVTNLVTKKDGVVIEDKVLHNSTYKGKSATIKRNTSGTVASSEGVTLEGESSIDAANPSGDAVESSGNVTNPGVGPGNVSGPDTQPTKPQTEAPGNMIEPSVEPTRETPFYPQSPADMTTSPADQGGPGGVGGPGAAVTNADPSNMGLIAPIG